LKELIFHIGSPKTGSSALQVFLAKNRKALLNSDVDYLPIGEFALGAAGKVSSGNGAFLSRCLLPDEASARIADGARHAQEFFEAVKNSSARLGLVSSELFIGADHDLMAELIGRLREMGITARCFYYIRSQVQLLASSYMQLVKRHGCTEGPADFIGREYRRRKYLKHHSFYLGFCGLFGRPNVLCRTYESAVQSPDGLFRGMMESLSIPADGLDFGVPDINTSVSTRDLCIMLLLNRFHPRMKFSDMVIENAVQFGTAASGQVHNFLPHALVRDIDKFFAEENARMAKDVFQRDELFPPRTLSGEQEHVSIDSLTMTDLIGFFGGLLVRYDERLVSLENRMKALNAPSAQKA
jgi:hypothetical protein